MKKLLVLFISCAFIFGLASCEKKESKEEKAKKERTERRW
jgi:hypothetical protein